MGKRFTCIQITHQFCNKSQTQFRIILICVVEMKVLHGLPNIVYETLTNLQVCDEEIFFLPNFLYSHSQLNININ